MWMMCFLTFHQMMPSNTNQLLIHHLLGVTKTLRLFLLMKMMLKQHQLGLVQWWVL
jgi:hypothetical protein